MTPIIDQYLLKLRIYKLGLVVFLTLNVFSICAALVIGIRYYNAEKDLLRIESQTIIQLKNIDEANSEILSFEDSLQNTKPPLLQNSKGETLEHYYMARLTAWQKLKSAIAKVQGVPIEDALPILTLDAQGLNQIQALRQKMANLQSAQIAALEHSIEEKKEWTSVIIWIGTFTLFFGILLPLAAIYLITKTIHQLRVEMQFSALNLIRAWADTKANFGDAAFKNVEFWLQIILLIGEQISHYSRHPLARLAGEMAFLVREELKKEAK